MNVALYAKVLDEQEKYKKYSGSFKEFIDKVEPSYQWYRHCKILVDALERVVSGQIRRLMVFMPPRHGKSETVSRLFPAFWLYRNPKDEVGLASYAADLAHGLSRDAMRIYSELALPDADISAAREWATREGGLMWATGMGGPITGKGFKLGIIDDPIKNAEEAESETIRKSLIDWYQSVWTTRREPDSAEIIIQTRWHEQDLAGWVLSQEKDSPQYWHIINFEALCGESRIEFSPTCTVEPDWRKVGDALCPERYPVEVLQQRKSELGSRYWSALYQQRPTVETGNIWKREYFRPFKLGTEPELIDIGADWDLAYTENDRNSASAYIKSGRDGNGELYVLDLGFRYLEFPELIAWMKSRECPHFIEAKASGKSATQTLRRDGVYAEEVQIRGGDKVARTRLATTPAEQGKIHVASHVLDMLLDDPKQGILKAGAGFESDLNDAFVQAINRHMKPAITVRIY